MLQPRRKFDLTKTVEQNCLHAHQKKLSRLHFFLAIIVVYPHFIIKKSQTTYAIYIYKFLCAFIHVPIDEHTVSPSV